MSLLKLWSSFLSLSTTKFGTRCRTRTGTLEGLRF
jgi:hypothetical protein